MDKEFQQYNLEDFLDDPLFCGWARSERPDLDKYYNSLLLKFPNQENTFRKAYRLINLFEDKKQQVSLERKVQLWKGINKTYQVQKNTRKRNTVLRFAAAVAAVIIIAISTWHLIPQNNSHAFFASYNIHDYKTTHLQFDNGKELNIDSQISKIVYSGNENPLEIDNKIVLKGKTKNKDAKNLLIVPYGKQSKIVLPDHTEVWLNSGSRLEYPSSFDGSIRKVLLQGEAYFKVTKNKTKPFIVETKNSKIRVLGTTFNVKAYPDEKEEETVLVEGSINLDLGKTLFSKDFLVKPGQRVIVNKNTEKYSVARVVVEKYTSWINGIFIFNDTPVPSALMSVSRYYDLPIKWDKQVASKKVSGKLDLKEDYHQVLNALEVTISCDFKSKNEIIYCTMKNE